MQYEEVEEVLQRYFYIFRNIGTIVLVKYIAVLTTALLSILEGSQCTELFKT